MCKWQDACKQAASSYITVLPISNIHPIWTYCLPWSHNLHVIAWNSALKISIERYRIAYVSYIKMEQCLTSWWKKWSPFLRKKRNGGGKIIIVYDINLLPCSQLACRLPNFTFSCLPVLLSWIPIACYFVVYCVPHCHLTGSLVSHRYVLRYVVLLTSLRTQDSLPQPVRRLVCTFNYPTISLELQAAK